MMGVHVLMVTVVPTSLHSALLQLQKNYTLCLEDVSCWTTERYFSQQSWNCNSPARCVSLACFGEPASALAACCAVPPDEAGRDAAEAAGLGDGRPRGEPVGAVRAVGAAPRPRLPVPR